MSLIVNADDFGLSSNVNKAIAECFSRGYINRTTIMVNMPGLNEAVELAKFYGFWDRIGLHITLTEGKPLTPGIAANPVFCDENGIFHARFHRNRRQRLILSSESEKHVLAEIKAQLDRYIELGFSLNHIDSHHHSHTDWPVLSALRILSADYQFSSIRISRNLSKNCGCLKRIYKSFYNHQIKQLCSKTTDYFGSYEDVQRYFWGSSGNAMLDTELSIYDEFIKSNNLEIMVHPMFSSDGILVDTEIPFEKEKCLYLGRLE